MAEAMLRTRVEPSPVGVLAWMSWTHFLNDAVANYLPGILPFLLSERHVPLALAGAFVTALGFGQGLQPVSGWIADRMGGRLLVLGGVALSTVSAALIGWAHPVWLILALLLFTGIGNTAFHPQALSTMRSRLGPQAGLGMSVFLVGGEIGRSLGPLAAGLVVHAYGLPWIWLLAVPLLVTYPWIVRNVPAQERRVRQGPPLRLRRHLKPAASLLVYALVRSGTAYEIAALAPIMWRARGGSLVTGALLVTVFIGVGIVGNLVGGHLNDRVGKGVVLYGTSFLAAVSLAGFALLQGAWIWPVLALMGIAVFGSSSTTMLVGQDIFRENPALGSGVALGLANGLGAILAIPVTYAASRLGDPAAAWILLALTVLTIPAVRGMPLSAEAAASATA